MRKKSVATIATLSVCAALMSGCSFFPRWGVNTEAIQHHYRYDNAEKTGIVQVFTINNKTAVQIRGLKGRNPVFTTIEGVEIPFTILGDTALLNEKYALFHVTTATGTSTITDYRINDTRPLIRLEQGSTVEGKVITVNEGEEARAEPEQQSASEKDELAGLRQQLAVLMERLARFEKSQKAVVTETQKFRIHFADNSAVFNPPADVAEALLRQAQSASEIHITGYTDANRANAGSRRLAEGRAQAAKEYLHKNDIDVSKVTLDHVDQGGFIVSNNTAAGKSKNRRVEIILK